jgi:integrase
MSTEPQPKGGLSRGGDDVRHSKEDALNDREFELLVEGSYRLDDDYFELESRLVIFLAGRLGMRAGEIAHLREEWVDWHRGMIVVPRHEECTDGRDGGICGHCRNAAKQMVDHNPGLSQSAAEDMMWSPKTENAAREIPLAASTRAKIVLERYFERFDEFTASRQGVNRRVDRAAEAADDELDAATTYPHSLRASCASHFASAGIDVVSLKSMMGWASYATAENYLAESGKRTEKALNRL